jgi:hypothetical protein
VAAERSKVRRDANERVDEWLPFGSGERLADREDLDGAVLLSCAPLVAGHGRIGGCDGRCDTGDGIKQRSLVRLHLDQQVVARGAGNLEGFFGNAWRRA